MPKKAEKLPKKGEGNAVESAGQVLEGKSPKQNKRPVKRNLAEDLDCIEEQPVAKNTRKSTKQNVLKT